MYSLVVCILYVNGAYFSVICLISQHFALNINIFTCCLYVQNIKHAEDIVLYQANKLMDS